MRKKAFYAWFLEMFQYPTLGSFLWKATAAQSLVSVMLVSVSYPRIVPMEACAGSPSRARCGCFSILPSDRSYGRRRHHHLDAAHGLFQYPTLGSFLWKYAPMIVNGAAGTMFQYPTLGSFLWKPGHSRM